MDENKNTETKAKEVKTAKPVQKMDPKVIGWLKLGLAFVIGAAAGSVGTTILAKRRMAKGQMKVMDRKAA